MMTVEILSEAEADPASRPAITLEQLETQGGHSPMSDLGRIADLVPLDPLWRRLEDWIAWRWGERAVTWILEGPGEWAPRLKPCTVSTVEAWEDGAWVAVTLDPSPLGGFRLTRAGPYRIVAAVGDTGGPPPEIVEALRRMAFYAAELWHDPGGTMSSGAGDDVTTRNPAWPARMLHNCGAADLVRRWRA